MKLPECAYINTTSFKPSICRKVHRNNQADSRIDSSSSQSPRSDRSAHNGRFRPCRSNSIFPPLWNFPPLLWESTLRLHLRSRHPRQHLPSPNPLPYVTTTRNFSFLSRYSRPRQSITHFFNPHISPLSFSSRILLIAASVD